ncbi:MAG TPA: hypothetical protein VH062_33045 [Polyangiaceae bacterium]|nr:hypothetical protein [Polyangiaceae bacterium]
MQVLEWKPAVWRSVRVGALAGTSSERVVRTLSAVVLVLGFWLRARGFLFSTLSLWLDEATWAIRMMDKPLVDNLIRPLGFMAVSKWLSLAFGPSETVLRLLPWTAGIATLFMAPALARLLFRSPGARLLFVCVIALHPAAVDLSKEFKPYSVSIALHMGLVLLALRYATEGKLRDLVLGLALALVAVLFAQDALFAYPGFFIVLAVAALRMRRFRHLAAVVLGGALTLGVVGALYVYVWSDMNQPKETKYWGKKYDVFYLPAKGTPDRIDWTASRYAELVTIPGTRRNLWASHRYSEERLAELRSLDALAWLVLHVAGLLFLIRGRRLREGLLLFLPLALTTGFNALGYWPLGEFRANLFALVYAAGIACFGMDRDARETRWQDLLPALVLVLFPLFFFERVWHGTKQMHTTSNEFPKALTKLARLQGLAYAGPREKLVTDLWSCSPFRYYTRYHPTFRESAVGTKLRDNLTIVCRNKSAKDILSTVRRELRTSPRVWLLATGNKVMNELDHAWPDDLDKVAFARIGKDDHLVAGITTKTVAPLPEPEPAPAPNPDAEGDTQPGDGEN